MIGETPTARDPRRDTDGADRAFDGSTSADDVVRGHDLAGRRSIMTGASMGPSMEAARTLAAAGWDVILTVRDVAAGRTVADAIAPLGLPPPRVEPLDLSNFASVLRAAERLGGQSIDLLVNSAGVMGTDAGVTQGGYEPQFAVNYLSHFALTLALLPELLAGGGAFVVNFSSAADIWAGIDLTDQKFEQGAHDRWPAFGTSKTANILLGVELTRRFGTRSFTSNTFTPGTIADADKRRSMPVFGVAPCDAPRMKVKSLAQAAATTLWSALSPKFAMPGRLHLKDCRIALPSVARRPAVEGRDFTLDPDSALALWTLGNKFIRNAAPGLHRVIGN